MEVAALRGIGCSARKLQDNLGQSQLEAAGQAVKINLEVAKYAHGALDNRTQWPPLLYSFRRITKRASHEVRS
jgi:hypothetical protein